MTNPYIALLKDIKEKSEKGLINWTRGSDPYTYKARLGLGSITIYYNPFDLGDPILDIPPTILSLSFINGRGDIFATVSSSGDKDENFEDLMQLYNSAHNNYMKIDETLQSMQKSLKELNDL